MKKMTKPDCQGLRYVMGQIKKGTSPSVVAIHRCDPEARKETLGGVLRYRFSAHSQNARAADDQAVPGRGIEGTGRAQAGRERRVAHRDESEKRL